MRTKSIVAAIVFSAVGAFAGGPANAQQDVAAALTVALAKPTERIWPETIPASGWLRPWHEAIVAAEIDGLRVTHVLVDVGSVVSEGQILVLLADHAVQAELRKAEALLSSARADLAKAMANADRARQVQGSGALSDEKITEYLIAEQTALAGAESAEASVESAKIKLSQTKITAADDGLITSRSAQLGAVVSSGTELFRLIRQQRVEWQAEVSARYLPAIEVDQTAAVEGLGKRSIEGTVRLIGPTISTDTGRVIAYVSLPAEAHPPIGLYVTGQIELETTAALTVPETALVLRDGMTYVFVVDQNGRASRLRVETGRRRDGEVEILSGLDRSTEVVAAGGAFLSDGALVRVEGEVR